MTGGRLLFLKNKIQDNFFCTYGDGISNVNLTNLVKFHNAKKKLVTVTAVRPPARFGEILIRNNKVVSFKEKPQTTNSWINGGFFVLNKKVFSYINDNQNCIFEREPLENLSKDGELVAFRHESFWHPVDTLRDKNYLNEIFNKGKAPWL